MRLAATLSSICLRLAKVFPSFLLMVSAILDVKRSSISKMGRAYSEKMNSANRLTGSHWVPSSPLKLRGQPIIKPMGVRFSR